MQTIFSYTREQRDFYDNESIHVPGIGEWSQKEYINKVDAFWADSYDDDDAWDDVIGDFPFENIHKAPTLAEAKSTDFDQKHIEVEPINGSRRARISAMIATKALQIHLEKIKFGQFMNQVSYIRAKYGGVLATKEGHDVVVAPWQQLITDQADVMSAPRIRRYFMSPSELSKMNGSWENVTAAMRAAEDFRQQDIGDDNSDETAESTGNLIEVFAVEGDLPKCLLYSAQADRDGTIYEEMPDDKYEYEYARVIFCGADWVKEVDGKRYENGIVFYAEKEAKPLQKFLVRNKMAGRGIGESVPEVLFEPQKWWNFYVTEETRMAAISGKKLYVTDDPDILANIFDEGVDHGTVLRVGQGKTLSELSQIPTGTPMYQNRRMEIKENNRELTSYFQANSGAESKSNVPFKAQYLQNIVGDSQFVQYRQEISFFHKEIIEDWVLQDALDEMAKKTELFTSFSPQELSLIDETLVQSKLIEARVESILTGKPVTGEAAEMMAMQVQRDLRKEGSKRTLTDIQEFIKEAGKSIRIHTSDEANNKAMIFESYNSLLQILDPSDPRFSAIVDKIMTGVGITKEELELYNDAALVGAQGQVKTEEMGKKQMSDSQAAVEALA